jgi:hypothetical protein
VVALANIYKTQQDASANPVQLLHDHCYTHKCMLLEIETEIVKANGNPVYLQTVTLHSIENRALLEKQ